MNEYKVVIQHFVIVCNGSMFKRHTWVSLMVPVPCGLDPLDTSLLPRMSPGGTQLLLFPEEVQFIYLFIFGI